MKSCPVMVSRSSARFQKRKNLEDSCQDAQGKFTLKFQLEGGVTNGERHKSAVCGGSDHGYLPPWGNKGKRGILHFFRSFFSDFRRPNYGSGEMRYYLNSLAGGTSVGIHLVHLLLVSYHIEQSRRISGNYRAIIQQRKRRINLQKIYVMIGV